MQQSRRVHGVFFPATNRTVLLINEDKLFRHGSSLGDDA